MWNSIGSIGNSGCRTVNGKLSFVMVAKYCVALLLTFGLVACQSTYPPVMQRLDERTMVTITYSRTPIPMVRAEQRNNALGGDLLQLGAIEVNRQGTRHTYVWLEIWDVEQSRDAGTVPQGYTSILLIADGIEIPLQVSHRYYGEIGISKAVYRKYYERSAEAFFEITPKQVEQLANATDLRLRTTGSIAKEFVIDAKSEISRHEFAEFMNTLSAT